MPTEKLILAQLYLLPESLKQEALHYISFLAKVHENKLQVELPKNRLFGSAEGKYILAPDFDAPLDDFKEYME